MKSLTKNIYTLTVLVAMLLLSCSKLVHSNPRSGIHYIYDKTNKIAFSYLVDTIDEDWILDDYGIRDWVESLPTKSISLATIANSYKIIGL